MEGADPKEANDTMFVGGIKDDMTEEMLREEFSKCGNIVNIKVMQGKGFAFIKFDDTDPVDWCSCEFIFTSVQK